MLEESGGEEFNVEHILDCVEFKDLVTKALKSQAKFSPASINEDKRNHSKYAFLVHWEGYGKADRTWEPEENLINCEQLKKFKEKRKMPLEHLKFEHQYNHTTWRQLGLAAEKVKGIRYLMTSEEVERNKEKKRAMLETMNIRPIKEKEKQNEKMVTPEGLNEIVKKKGRAIEEEDYKTILAGNAEISDLYDPSSTKLPLKSAQEDLDRLTKTIKKYPIKVNATRITRDFSSALNLRKFRRCQSAEQLCEQFSSNAEMEIFARNFENSVRLEKGGHPIIVKVFPKVSLFKTQEIMTEYDEDQLIYKELAKKNVMNMRKAINNTRNDKDFLELLENLAVAYSEDDNNRYEKLFRYGFPNEPMFDGYKFMAIVFTISFCQHRLWDADPKGMIFVESDKNEAWGEVRQQEVLCCEDHRKCTWMRLFLELIPARLRFIETSGRCYHGWDGDDGPFRDDVYFHCMKYGSECQKRLFFDYNKPIGIQEERVGEYSVDAMHILAVQRGNIQRIASYLSLGGLDINALATHMPTKQVLRLQEYLKKWREENLLETNSIDVHRKYYRHLQDMIRITGESLEIFIENEVRQMIFNRMDGRWKIHMDLTYPHILRCSPQNNRSNYGDGTHQVLSCLFYPQAVGYRDGLENLKNTDAEKFDKLNASLRKYRKLVSEEKGRLVLVLFRVEIEYQTNVRRKDKFVLPKFKLVESDAGMKIEALTLLRQTPGLDALTADIGMFEMTPFTKPGCRYYGIKEKEQEHDLIVPGNAHIEVRGEFDEPMSFATQVFFIKKNI